jgi:hypothetical protein
VLQLEGAGVLALIGVAVFLLDPRLALAALPVLLVAICPLSMLFMMRGMRRRPETTREDRSFSNRQPTRGPDPQLGSRTRKQQLAALRARMAAIQDRQDAITRLLAQAGDQPDRPTTPPSTR